MYARLQMLKLSAIILLICLGILLPVSAMPVRICLLAFEERTDTCCNACDSDVKDCCADVDAIPDGTAPHRSLETAVFGGHALPPASLAFAVPPERIVPTSCRARLSNWTCPTSARLAVLGVWIV